MRNLFEERESDYEKALITGITGQDRSYLAELLLEKGYEVHGDAGGGWRRAGQRTVTRPRPDRERPLRANPDTRSL